MKTYLTVFLATTILCSISLYGIDTAMASTPIKTITMSIEQWARVQGLFKEQAQALNESNAEKYFWMNQYTSLVDCIRETAKAGEPETTCIGDQAL